MRTLIKIIVFLILVGCKNDQKKHITKSSFDLKKDFSKITESITELDTIVALIDLTLYHHDFRNERLEISSFGDSLKILISSSVGLEIIDENGDTIESPYTQGSLKVQGERIPETITIHKKDALWKFDSLISKNLDSLVSVKRFNYPPRLIFGNNSDTLYFDFTSKNEWRVFKKEYCEMMYGLTPENEFYNTFVKDFFTD